MRRQIFSIGMIVLEIILTIGCENNSTSPGIDYTGQVDTITDIEGNTYTTIGIGSQIWMAQNLRTNRLNDGTYIPEVINDSIWARLQTPAFCWYNNDSNKYQNIYGPLYNFYVISTGLLCPIGWHVPVKSEWETLTSFVGGEKVAGGKLKESDGSHWKEPNTCIVNNYNFIALPGGCRKDFNGEFLDIGNIGYWGTSSSVSFFIADCFSMLSYGTQLVRFETNKREGHNVRCIKD
jgi:uncharacterized protein (TIGR02145 family)